MTTDDRNRADEPTYEPGDRMTDEPRERMGGGAATTVAPSDQRPAPEVPDAPAVDVHGDADAEAGPAPRAEADAGDRDPAPSTADLARAGSATEEQAQASAQGGPGSDETDEGGERAALFAEDEASGYRDRWQQVQTEFVDDPRQAVQRADTLVAELMQRLAETFAAERSDLEAQWDRGGEVSTEDLRVSLRRYRSFFDRLLSL
jgi:hypothetical protein